MIAFTYDVNTPVGQVRLFAGDTNPDGLNRTGGDRTRTDDEINALLTQNGGRTRLAAAQLLEIKAAEFAALATDIRQGSLRQDFRIRSQRMLEAAAALRANANEPAIFNPPSQDPPFTTGPDGTMTDW